MKKTMKKTIVNIYEFLGARGSFKEIETMNGSIRVYFDRKDYDKTETFEAFDTGLSIIKQIREVLASVFCDAIDEGYKRIDISNIKIEDSNKKVEVRGELFDTVKITLSYVLSKTVKV